MALKKDQQRYGPRIIVECPQHIKDLVEKRAAERGFTVKNYIIHLLNNDIPELIDLKEKPLQ